MSEAEEQIQIVDRDDNPVGGATKHEAWRNGLLRRSARIMIEDAAGNVLLQKRASTKELYPDRWDNSTAGHVDVGEDYLTAAKRELFEEIGLKDLELQELGKYYAEANYQWMNLKGFSMVYKVVVDPEKMQLNLEPEEVAMTKWFSRAALKELVQDPDAVTDGLYEVATRFYP